jgi:DNA mismatch endonuclease (patch repair protein)
MSPEKRSALMARIRGKNTGPERLLAREFRKVGLRWTGHDRTLPGRPDFVFRGARLAVFVDGDFWHGWRFGRWRHKLSEKWEAKIQANRDRDLRNHRKLRRMGWQLVRIWEHQIERELAAVAARIAWLVEGSRCGRRTGRRPHSRSSGSRIARDGC